MEINNLLEDARGGYKSMQADAEKLASKWQQSGLLEGLDEKKAGNMAMILENQAKQLVMEESNTGGPLPGAGTFTPGTGAQWAGVALPLVRKVFGQIAAKEFVSVQPMNLPSGLVFYLDFQYGTTKAPFAADSSVYGDVSGFASNGTEGGLYGAGRFGYSINNTSSAVTGTQTTGSWADVNFDSDLSASAVANTLRKVTFAAPTNADLDGVRGFVLTGANLTAAENKPAYTSTDGTNVSFIIDLADATGTGATAAYSVEYQLQPADNARGDFEDGNNTANGSNSPIAIPEINVEMKSSAIVAKTRKLKAVWTPEFAQDLNAYHSLDAEAELTSIMSEYISLEIDQEILSMLIEDAGAGDEYWSAINNQSISAAGAGAGLGFFNSQGQWFQTLGTKIQKLSNIIHQKTLRGGANFMVLSPTVSTIIESIPGFAGDADGQVDKANYAFGVQKVGALGGGKIKVYKNPYMTENLILMGYRGSQFLETGAVFAPYIPLIMTPLVYDPETFTPRKGLLTRYAKKMLRPEFYGKIYISGLNTI